ncbi:MAG: hypothetical protein KKB22_00720 [Candidatus Omnitrophica bacterium]|nr:hypothetical protein [Candidatus Omnitrophota bacterium]
MKNISIIILILATVFTIGSFGGCGQREKLYGEKITEEKVTPIGNILSTPDNFKDKSVKVQGKITDECPAGGWFYLKDNTGIVYVNLHPSYFAIPQVRGKEVTAQGRLRKEGTQIEIVGEGVELK